MIRNMASSLILNEYIVTTKAKAKVCKAFVDKVISRGKRKDPHTERMLVMLLRDNLAVEKIINVLREKYKDRVSGFVTSVSVGYRKGDDAAMTKLVLVGAEPFRKAKKVKTKTRRKAKAKERELQEIKKEKRGLGLLDRVRELRGRLRKGSSDQRKIGQRREFSKGPQEGGTRSRSGI